MGLGIDLCEYVCDFEEGNWVQKKRPFDAQFIYNAIVNKTVTILPPSSLNFLLVADSRFSNYKNDAKAALQYHRSGLYGLIWSFSIQSCEFNFLDFAQIWNFA